MAPDASAGKSDTCRHCQFPLRIPIPFPHDPCHGVITPHELARRFRDEPRLAIPLLEDGTVASWFDLNGWPYPVTGSPVHGLCAVQQFLDYIGLSTVPTVTLLESHVRIGFVLPHSVPAHVRIQTEGKKLVYATVESDTSWLTILTPAVTGQGMVDIRFATDAEQVTEEGEYEGSLTITANGGQTFTVAVVVEVLQPMGVEEIDAEVVGLCRLIADGEMDVIPSLLERLGQIGHATDHIDTLWRSDDERKLSLILGSLPVRSLSLVSQQVASRAIEIWARTHPDAPPHIEMLRQLCAAPSSLVGYDVLHVSMLARKWLPPEEQENELRAHLAMVLECIF